MLMIPLTRLLPVFAVCLLLTASAFAQIKHGLRDEAGRHEVARGFVLVTHEDGDEVVFDADDYTRMVRMGANYQVIRLALGNLSRYPGSDVKEPYLKQLDGLVALGREAGIKTVFKMTVYNADGFDWEDFWRDRDDSFNIYLDAWKTIWSRYQDDPTVVGYDLINEPRKEEMDVSYDDLTHQYLLPYHQRLIDQKNKYSPEKVSICQSIFMNKGDGEDVYRYTEFKQAIDRDNVYLSPHIYLSRPETVRPVMERLERECDLWNAPMFIGEWGFPTYESADTSFDEQQEYTKLYVVTADVFDETGVGIIKAWFSGNPKMQNFMPRGRSTWAIFSEKNAVGTTERKYITDVIARPYPQLIAGDIESFHYDHATRHLSVDLTTDNTKGESHLFVGANRHYPDGFTFVCGDDLKLAFDPIYPSGLQVVQSPDDFDPNEISWDQSTQRLTIRQFPADKTTLKLVVMPGIPVDEVVTED